jgi:hypothetical protein
VSIEFMNLPMKKPLGTGGPLRQPLRVAIGPSDMAVCTRRDVDDNVSFGRHDVLSQFWVGHPEETSDNVNACILPNVRHAHSVVKRVIAPSTTE